MAKNQFTSTGAAPAPITDLTNHVANIMGHVVEDATGFTAPRQILQVETYTLFTAGYRHSDAAPETRGSAHIALAGTPTPSSNVTNGYIYFVPRADLPSRKHTPQYNPGNKQIKLWLDEAHLPMVLAQLKQTRRYLWVGFFNNGHVYGDLHTAD